jgi:hypothetical protein
MHGTRLDVILMIKTLYHLGIKTFVPLFCLILKSIHFKQLIFTTFTLLKINFLRLSSILKFLYQFKF